jgi:hypothetical protein
MFPHGGQDFLQMSLAFLRHFPRREHLPQNAVDHQIGIAPDR